jgi:hypothetical protein
VTVSTQRYVAEDLTHFVGAKEKDSEARFTLLVRILRSGELLINGDPRYTKETQSATRFEPTTLLSEGGLFKPHAVCFCDIPLDDLAIHMGKYGSFGIAFSKEFLLKKGTHPVFYVPRNPTASGVHRAAAMDRIGTYMAAHGIRGTSPGEEWHGIAMMIENEILCFMKAFDATLPEDDPDNYYYGARVALADASSLFTT